MIQISSMQINQGYGLNTNIFANMKIPPDSPNNKRQIPLPNLTSQLKPG